VEIVMTAGAEAVGAVEEAVKSYATHDLEFVELIFPAVVEARKIVEQGGGDPNDPDQVIPIATEQNVILGVKELRESSFFKAKVDAGTLLIAGGVYDLATSRVNILIQ